MSRIERGLRRFAGCLAALTLSFCVAMPGWAKDAPAAASVPALPQPLTKESIRELVSRLSDDDVRKLLLDQLDRAATTATPDAKPGMGMAGVVDEHAGAMRTTLGSLEAAYYALPDTLRSVAIQADRAGRHVAACRDRGASRRAARCGFSHRVALSSGAAWIPRAPRPESRSAFSARAFQLGMGLLIDLGGVLVWSIAAVTAFFLLWHDHALRRTLILDFMLGVIIVRTTMVVARFLLAPACAVETTAALRGRAGAHAVPVLPSSSSPFSQSRSRWSRCCKAPAQIRRRSISW
jgi:hypothetical protein